MTTGKRAANRAGMESEILRLGREQLSTRGAADLSLRAIARDLGVVSSAVYRYVPSRDDLLTLLLVQSYDDLADATEAAAGSAAGSAEGEGHRAQILAIGAAARRWALADPSRWALLYGSPVPGYAAPGDQTIGPGTRVIAQLLGIVDRAAAAGELAAPPVAESLHADLAAVRAEFGVSLGDAEIAAAMLAWSTLIGAISLEVFGQYGAEGFAAADQLFTAQFDSALSLLFA